MKSTGLTLLVIGLILTLLTTFKFFTKEKVIDLGAVEITREKPHTFNWSPVVGIFIMAIGGVILYQAKNKT